MKSSQKSKKGSVAELTSKEKSAILNAVKKPVVPSKDKTEKKEVEPSKDKKVVEKVAEKTKNVVKQVTINNRDLMYIYPDGCNDTLKRKSFRQKVRNHMESLIKKYLKAEGKAKEAALVELNNYKKEVLVDVNCEKYAVPAPKPEPEKAVIKSTTK